MIDQISDDGTGLAVFSDDMLFRYRLARSLTGRPITMVWSSVSGLGDIVTDAFMAPIRRVVWVLCNPSTADAFKADPTVTECVKRATALGADVTEVVNLWALRSPYPTDLRKHACGFRGDDAINDKAILEACTGASMVIAAWGNDGELDHRNSIVRTLLDEAGIKLHHLGFTKRLNPKHPLARGKHRIPADLQPAAWIA